MEIILTKQCESLSGSLGKGFGYFIVGRWSRKDVRFRYYSQRSKWDVPTDGHIRFIIACAELAQMKTHITDIRVSRGELRDAIWEAGFFYLADYIVANPKIYPDPLHADDINNLKNNWIK